MVICNKCNIEKPIDQYYKEIRWGKTYYKKYCMDCWRKQSREWKARNRISKQRQEELDKEEQRVKHLLVNGGKYCTKCNELKLPDEYYINRTLCKECVRHIEREKDRVEREQREEERLKLGLSNKRVPARPGDYADELQRTSTFEMMTIMGWSYNPDNDTFYKLPLKDHTGLWLNLKDDGDTRTLNQRKRFLMRRNITIKNLPQVSVDKHRRKSTPTDEVLNDICYDYFINKLSITQISKKYEINTNSAHQYISMVYKIMEDDV